MSKYEAAACSGASQDNVVRHDHLGHEKTSALTLGSSRPRIVVAVVTSAAAVVNAAIVSDLRAIQLVPGINA